MGAISAGWCFRTTVWPRSRNREVCSCPFLLQATPHTHTYTHTYTHRHYKGWVVQFYVKVTSLGMFILNLAQDATVKTLDGWFNRIDDLLIHTFLSIFFNLILCAQATFDVTNLLKTLSHCLFKLPLLWLSLRGNIHNIKYWVATAKDAIKEM